MEYYQLAEIPIKLVAVPQIFIDLYQHYMNIAQIYKLITN